MNRFLPAAVFLLAYLCAFTANARPLKSVFQQEQSQQAEQYVKQIARYRYDKPDSALYLVKKGLSEFKQKHNREGEAVLLNQLGMIYDNQGKYEDSHQQYAEALNIYRLLKQEKGMATEMIRLGVVEERKGNYDRATSYYLQALNISERTHDAKGIMEANIVLGAVFMDQQQYKKARHYQQIAEAINDTIPFSNLSLNLYNDAGMTLTHMGSFAAAKKYFNKGINASNNLKQYQGLNITLMNHLADVYTQEGNTTYAIRLFKEALQKSRAIHNFIREEQSLNGLAKTYRSINTDTSLAYLAQAKTLAERKGVHKQVIESLGSMADVYVQRGDYKAADKARTEQYSLADKYYYKDMAQKIASLQAEYELSKSKTKIHELRYLNRQQQLQHYTATAVAAGAILIMLIGTGFYYRTQKLNVLLRKTNSKLDESNHVKDKLLSIIGHDLRAPFISVINLLSFIDDKDLPEESRKELIKQLGLTTNASLETLDSLLRWGEMQLKGIRLNPARFALKPLTNRILILLQETAAHKSITLENNVEELTMAYADVNHVEFVLRNLISNAIKFTGTGGRVMVSAVLAASGRHLTIAVEDNGVGIPAEKLQHIFNLNNVSSDGTYNEKGTSLGLMMCQEFVRANQGSIHVESEPGKGSVFMVQLPVTPGALLRKRPRFRVKLFRQPFAG